MVDIKQFIESWRGTTLNESSGAKPHFIELCQALGYDAPSGTGTDKDGKIFMFEYGMKKDGGGQGFADVFYENHFAIEYKAPGKYKTLDDALIQLKQYRENLKNPPLLIVTDIENWEIHTNFTNAVHHAYKFNHDEISQPHVLKWLRDLFENPNNLHPGRTTAQVTIEAANSFQRIADNMRDWEKEPERIANFLTKLVFCVFAEDIGLLPILWNSTGIFSRIVIESVTQPSKFEKNIQALFVAMANGGEMFLRDIPWFNGTLFDDVEVEELLGDALNELRIACKLDWASVEPAIFGTLFERSLDPSKRSQLGAHYTGREDILLIVEPVLMQPLRREWTRIRAEAEKVRAEFDTAPNQRSKTEQRGKLEALREEMLTQLREVTVLDPACGSGNFLYVSLGLLLDMEKEVIIDRLWIDTGMETPSNRVHPKQLHGIEINHIAHALSSIVVWIGYIQWYMNNGLRYTQKPILHDLKDNFQLMDAIMKIDDDGQPTEPNWPKVDVIMGNPPFLGGKMMRTELGDGYVDTLFKLWEGRIPHEADLVTYWFEQARNQIENGNVKRAGLLATNSIRGGANREVLKRIKESGNIFMGWSDRPWIRSEDGASVRISMVGFDDGTEDNIVLKGVPVATINSDLTSMTDITIAECLSENAAISYMGITPTGKFVIDGEQARKMLKASSDNKEVLFPYLNGMDITRNSRDTWIVDFTGLSLEEASKYKLPMKHVVEHVKPFRDAHKTKKLRENWWLHEAPRPGMRAGLASLDRYIVTPTVAKHRLFVWLDTKLLPDHQLIATTRDDDYFFGVLHSKLHEVWSLRMGTWLGKGNDPRYTPTTTFETFPFPWSPGAEDTASEAHKAISAVAKLLHEERDTWLNPADTAMVKIKERTLTNLYNALAAYREMNGKKRDKPENIKCDAWEFAPRLAELHDALDRAVCDAYGWPHDVLDDEEDILRRLLELNLQRAK